MKKKSQKAKTKYDPISRKNRLNAWKWFELHGYKDHKGMVLHHVDTSLKENDHERYVQWNVSDLQVMTVAEHMKLHMKDKQNNMKRTRGHNKRISKGLKNTTCRGMKVMIHRNYQAEETLVFDNFALAARYIGCTRQLVSQCLQKHQRNKNKTAKGWSISLISKED